MLAGRSPSHHAYACGVCGDYKRWRTRAFFWRLVAKEADAPLQHIWSWQKGSENYQGSMCKTLQALWRNVSCAVIGGVMGFNSPAQPGPTRTQIPHNLSLFSWLNSEITDDAYFYLPKITVTLAMKTSAWEVWGDGSAVKSTCYSSRGPGFGSQNPHKGSQPSITAVPEDRLSSSALLGY